MTTKPLGLIGVGLLGSAIAQRLLLADFSILAYDTDRSSLARLEKLGGQSADSAEEVAQNCETILLSLPNSLIAGEVIDELKPQLSADTIIIDTTTGDPEHSVALGQELQKKKIDYLDATVAGSSEQARQGEVLVMAGGCQKAFQACDKIFASFAKQTFYLGPCGSGARMKLVFNLVLGLNRAVLAEGLTLAERCGIAPQKALEILQAGAAFSRVMDTKGQKMIRQDFTPQARLAQHLKDVELILELGQRNQAQLPLSKGHQELLERAVSLGHGQDDNSAIIKAFQ